MRKNIVSLIVTMAACGGAVAGESFTDALIGGKASVDLRLRYESVEQDNALKDADALTLRTRVGYRSGDYKGFSGKIEFEDVRDVAGVDDYSVGPTGFKPGQFSVIADPASTEVDQGFVQYKNKLLSAKLGRQVITYDGHRFVGHVGWRQDRQTFDGLTVTATPVKDLVLSYGYIDQRNRIFAESADINSEDHLVNIAYKTPIGKLVTYAYMLEVDNSTSNSLDTYGASLKGSTKFDTTKLLYAVELASQDSENGATQFDADYLFLEGGLVISGITAKLGYEVLGSDNGSYGFSTPLATLHKFNGWADQFLGTPAVGLVDTSVSLGGKALGGKWKLVYHDYEADEASASVDDLGSEVNLLFAKKFAKYYNAGIKYATYSAGDVAAGKVDTDKLWLWVGAKF